VENAENAIRGESSSRENSGSFSGGFDEKKENVRGRHTVTVGKCESPGKEDP